MSTVVKSVAYEHQPGSARERHIGRAVAALGLLVCVLSAALTAGVGTASAESCQEGFCGTPTINLLPTGSAGVIPTATPTAPVQPVASPMEDSAAISAFAGEFGAATAVGGFGGTVAGAGIGCAVGGIVTAPTLVFIPAGCLAGAVTGAGIGGVVGTIVVGGPALALAGTDLVGTLTAAPGTTKWVQR